MKLTTKTLFTFINGFEIFPSEFSLQNIRPALSAVVYKCPEFYPLKFEKLLPNSDNHERITIDWEGVDIKSESKGIGNRISRNSIQFHMIELLKASDDYSLIFNDDGSGEIADIVLVKEDLSVIKIDLYHLKYSSGDTPGARIQDLYEVCGQAQKSIKWKRRKSYEIFNHILLRGAMKPIRYEKGDSETVRKLLEMSKQIPIEYTIHIVQPGISKNKIKENQDISELLSVTDSYLMDTYMIPLKVITSE